jgi:hypothetical protein
MAAGPRHGRAIPIPNQGAIFVGSSFCSSTYDTVRLRRLNPRRLDFILDLKSVLLIFPRLLGATGTAAALFGRGDLLNRLG